MKVKILVEFDVPGTDDENIAKSAASVAAYKHLAFCTALNMNPGRDSCEVHVEGYGKLRVRLGEDHE